MITFFMVVMWWILGSFLLAIFYLYGFHRGPISMLHWTKQSRIFLFLKKETKTKKEAQELLKQLERTDSLLELSDGKSVAAQALIALTIIAPLLPLIWLSETITLYQMGDIQYDEAKVRFVLQGGDPDHLELSHDDSE